MAQAQKPDFVFRRNGRVHLNRLGRQFNRLLAAEVCASAVVMLDTTMFRGSVKSTGYSLHLPVSPSLPQPVCHRVPSRFNWNLPARQKKRCDTSKDYIIFKYMTCSSLYPSSKTIRKFAVVVEMSDCNMIKEGLLIYSTADQVWSHTHTHTYTKVFFHFQLSLFFQSFCHQFASPHAALYPALENFPRNIMPFSIFFFSVTPITSPNCTLQLHLTTTAQGKLSQDYSPLECDVAHSRIFLIFIWSVHR
jgi:hypothetical protein